VTAKDSFGNTATGYGGTIHFTSSDPAPAVVLPGNYTFVGGDAGAHTFVSSVTLTTAGPQSVTATDTVVGSISGSQFTTVLPGPAKALAVGLPPSLAAGSSASLSVSAFDTFGNLVTGYAGTIHFTTSDTSPSVALPSNYTFVAGDAGSHTFTNGVTLATAGTQTVTATDTVNAIITGGASTSVTAGALSQLVVSPSSATAEAPITASPANMNVSDSNPYPTSAAFSAEGFDAYGNDLGDETGAATWSVSGGGSCAGASCSPGYNGPANVTATVGAVTNADAVLTGAYGSLAYSCTGDYYDVDNSLSDGCEAFQPAQFHTKDTAGFVGSYSCSDSAVGMISEQLPSDQRVHENPIVAGFDPTSGSAPLWFSINATGGFTCVNDYNVTLSVSTAVSPQCYDLTVITDKGTASGQTNSLGSVTLTAGSGSYSDNTTVYLEVNKVSGCFIPDDPSFTIQFHL
jgi:hypothetical protein